MNILPLCEYLWKWWPLYLESNLRGEKSFLHIGDLATEEGSQRKAGRRWLLWTTSAPLCTPDPPKIGLCHLSIRAPGSRLSSTNPALNSGGVWAKSIFQWSPCDVPSKSWIPIVIIVMFTDWLQGVIMVLTEEGSISRNRRGQSLEEKQKGTEPRPISIIWAAAQGYFAPSCNAMQCTAVQCKGKLCANDWIQWDFTHYTILWMHYALLKWGRVSLTSVDWDDRLHTN